MTAYDSSRSSLSLLSLLLFRIVNLIDDSVMSSSSSHPPWQLQLWIRVGMISNMRMRKIKTGIIPINDVRVLLVCDAVESFI